MYGGAKYIFIIAFVTAINFLFGILIEKAERRYEKLLYLNLSLIINIGILVFFKYSNFVLENIFGLLNIFNPKSKIPLFELILPLGLSYYIFQTIGYIIDVFRGSQNAERNIFHFSLFMLFFPKLLVGPIERAHHFLPQTARNFRLKKENIIEGLRRIAWGIFKKLVVADRISIYENFIMKDPGQYGGFTMLFATVLYTFQVYADFSGYTDIAIGTARLFGFDLMENFRRPLLAKNISDFWRRWHISLSSWVNDYIFNPIAFKRRDWGNWGVFYALVISFVVIGIWHGPSWNYVLFGLLQAFALIYETITKKQRKKISKKAPAFLYNGLSILLTFLFVSFSLIIFRTSTISDAMVIIRGIFSPLGHLYYDKAATIFFMLIGCLVMMIADAGIEFRPNGISLFRNNNWVVKNLSYAFLVIYILLAGVFDGGQFIYIAY